MMISRWIFAGLLGLVSSLALSQNYSKLWMVASYFGRDGQLLYNIEPQIRLVNRANGYDESLINASVGTLVIPHWQFWFGQNYSNYSDRNAVDEDVSNRVQDEYRVWEQILWNVPFKDQYSSRLRFEQRRSFQSSQWGLRIRERAYWMIPLKKRWYVAVNDECFLNLNSVPWVKTTTFDQNRLSIGFFYFMKANVGLNVGYMNQYINKKPAEANNVLFISLIRFMS